MTETEALDKILEIALYNKGRGLGLKDLRDSGINFEYDQIRYFLKLIEKSNFDIAELQTIENGEFIIANENTERFLKSGGFIAIEKREIVEFEYNKSMKENQLKKIEYELQLNKWQIKTKWLPLAISGTSLIVSIIAIVLSLRQPEKNESKPKIKTTEDTTSVSSQTRTVDSLTIENI